MGWLRDVKTATAQTQAPESKGYVMSGGAGVRGPYVSFDKDWPVEKVVEDALKRVTWVFRCVQAIASNAARIPIVVRVGDAWDGEIVEDHELYKLLNSRPNKGETSYTFRYRVAAQILLSNKGVFIQVKRNRNGKIESLELLPPQHMKVNKSAENFVDSYEIHMTITDENGYQRQLDEKFEPEEIIWIRNPHPFDPYASLTPMASIGLAIETDWYAKMYNRNFLLNDGRPGGIVVLKGDTTPEDKEDLQARFRGNIQMAGRITILGGGQGADFVDTATNPRDAQYVDTRTLTKEEILMGFGVPESVLSNAAGRTFDNAEMERLIFWEETMLPHLDLTTREFDVLDEDDNKYVGVDTDRVDVLQRMEIKRKEYSLREFTEGLISINEYRQDTGKKKTKDARGNVLFRANTRIPYATTDGKPLPEGSGLMNGPLPVPDLNAQPGAQGGRPPGKPAREEPENEPREREDDRVKPTAATQKSYAEEFDRAVSMVDTTVKRFFDRQQRVVIEKMGGEKTRKLLSKRDAALQNGPVSGPSKTGALNLSHTMDGIYQQKVWDKQLSDDLKPLLTTIVKNLNEAMAADVEVEDDLYDALVAKALKVNVDTREKISDALVVGMVAEEDLHSITTMVGAMFEASKASISETLATQLVGDIEELLLADSSS